MRSPITFQLSHNHACLIEMITASNEAVPIGTSIPHYTLFYCRLTIPQTGLLIISSGGRIPIYPLGLFVLLLLLQLLWINIETADFLLISCQISCLKYIFSCERLTWDSDHRRQFRPFLKSRQQCIELCHICTVALNVTVFDLVWALSPLCVPPSSIWFTGPMVSACSMIC